MRYAVHGMKALYRQGMRQALVLGAALAVMLACAFPSTASRDEPYTPFAVHLTDDPQGNVMGWSHAFAVRDPRTDRWLFMPLMGHNHSPDTDNSVRVYDAQTDRWEYWQPDLHDQLSREEWFAGKNTDPPSASGRNNYIGFYLPWEGEAGQIWIAAPGDSLAGNHGIFDIAERRWTHLVPNDEKTRFAPIEYTNDLAHALVNGWNYADVVCEEHRTLVRYGGKNSGILVLVEPKPDGNGYVATGYGSQPPGRRNSVRNTAICADGNVYLFGGTDRWKGEPVDEVWRFDLEKREWNQLPPTGHAIPPSAVVTHDLDTGQAAILFSDGSNRYATYDLETGAYRDLTDALRLPQSRRASGAFVPGVGHLYRGGRWGAGSDWTSSRMVYCVSISPTTQCGR